jgi:hypothetical protein
MSVPPLFQVLDAYLDSEPRPDPQYEGLTLAGAPWPWKPEPGPLSLPGSGVRGKLGQASMRVEDLKYGHQWVELLSGASYDDYLAFKRRRNLQAAGEDTSPAPSPKPTRRRRRHDVWL